MSGAGNVTAVVRALEQTPHASTALAQALPHRCERFPQV